MKQQYKIKTTNTELSDEKILRHKNFDQLLTNYKSMTDLPYKKPLYKNPKLFMSLFLAGTVAVLVYLGFREDSIPASSENVLPPVNDSLKIPGQGAEPAFAVFDMDPKKSASFFAADQVGIVVPPNAFVDENGNQVDEKVQIKFRETEHVGSYDTDSSMPGHQFELFATLNNKAIALRNGLSVTVIFSATSEDAANGIEPSAYFQDPVSGKWQERKGLAKVGGRNLNNGWDGFGVIENPGENNAHIVKRPGMDSVQVSDFVLRMKVNTLGVWAVN